MDRLCAERVAMMSRGQGAAVDRPLLDQTHTIRSASRITTGLIPAAGCRSRLTGAAARDLAETPGPLVVVLTRALRRATAT
jgi:hypothetical protein